MKETHYKTMKTDPPKRLKKIISVDGLNCSGVTTACKRLYDEYSKLGRCKIIQTREYPMSNSVYSDSKHRITNPNNYYDFYYGIQEMLFNDLYEYMYPETGANIADYIIIDQGLLTNFMYIENNGLNSKFASICDFIVNAGKTLEWYSKPELYGKIGVDIPDVHLRDIFSMIEHRIVLCDEDIRLKRISEKETKNLYETPEMQARLSKRLQDIMEGIELLKSKKTVFKFGEPINGMTDL